MTNLKSTMIRLSLALSLAGTIAACEDVPTPAPKTRPPVAETTPAPTPTTPAPASTLPTPEVVKPEPVVVKSADVKDDDKDKPLDTIAAARKMLDTGEVDKALELGRLATLKTPKRSAAWNVRGRAELRAGKRKDAIASFEKAVELNPKSSYARNNLGLALIYDEQYEKAVDSLEVAVELEPVTEYMWNNLGMAYEQLDRLDDAREAYGNAVTMDSALARASLARLKGVETIIRTAKAEPETKVAPGMLEGTTDGTGGKPDKPTATQ
jgi:Flp pilus assembly protein TadD